MKLRVLVENECFSGNYETEFGLSLYLEADGKKLLFDTGASDMFLRNAQKMGIDIAEVDTLILSHGHYDHGGGLKAFLQANATAKVYLHSGAFGGYYSKKTTPPSYLGLDRSLAENPRLVFTGDHCALSPALTLFAGVTGRRLFSPSNANLFEADATGALTPDRFAHEQSLVVRENGHTVLLSGCCHNGILNTLDRADALGLTPDIIVSGMHFLRLDLGRYGALVDEISAALKARNVSCFTCHCTGLEPFARMKQTLGAQLTYIDTGAELEF